LTLESAAALPGVAGSEAGANKDGPGTKNAMAIPSGKAIRKVVASA
jgi:hypothetical protein